MATATLSEIEIPAPGLYPDVPAEVYHRWPAASQTVLKIMRDRSPAHARAYMDHPPEPTPAMVLGVAIHAAILQSDVFERMYVRAPEVDRRTKAGREAWEALEAEHPGAIILRPEEYQTCLAIRDAVWAHPAARRILQGAEAELSAVWEDTAPGHKPFLSKGRFDVVNRRYRLLADLKTTKDASSRSFKRDIYRYFWYGQAGHYLPGAKALGIDVDAYLIIAVEKEPPYGVAVYSLSGRALEAAIEELNRLKAIYAECMQTGHWPCYSTDIHEIDMPSWSYFEIEEGTDIA